MANPGSVRNARRRRRVRRRTICPICHQPLSHVPREQVNYDHIYPRNPPDGWPPLPTANAIRNLWTVHAACNGRKGNRITLDGLYAYRAIMGHWPQPVGDEACERMAKLLGAAVNRGWS